ncbi:MAG: trigger factor [Calditrichaeota bacterium]|nr:trigger factor [Calditrichota bacterium]
MEVKIEDHEQFQKKVEVKVPYEELSDKIDAKYQQYKKTVQLEGFRRGKVPLSLLKKVYGKQIETETAEDAIPEFLQKAIDQEKIKYYDMVSINDVAFSAEEGLSFAAIVKVEPDIELRQYKDLELEKIVYQVSDEDVEEALENIREQYATMNNVEDGAQAGHFIIADLQKTDALGHPLVGEKFDNRYLQLQTDNEDDEVVKQLLGVKPGEMRQIALSKKESEEGAEEQDYFSVSVKEIKEKKLPELDDDFAKDVGEDSLEDLKKTLRERLENNAVERDNENFQEVVIDKIIKNNPIDIPEFMVEGYLDALIKNFKERNQEQFDEQEIRQNYRAEAVRNLKWMMIRDKIIELEDIKVEDSEIDDHIEDLAKKAGKDAPQVRREYRSDKMRRQLKQEIFHKKTLDVIINNAKVVEKSMTREDLIKQSEITENISAV